MIALTWIVGQIVAVVCFALLLVSHGPGLALGVAYAIALMVHMNGMLAMINKNTRKGDGK